MVDEIEKELETISNNFKVEIGLFSVFHSFFCIPHA